MNGKLRSGHSTLIGKTETKRPLARHRCIDGRIIIKWILKEESARI
jgi:hypothetical protein